MSIDFVAQHCYRHFLQILSAHRSHSPYKFDVDRTADAGSLIHSAVHLAFVACPDSKRYRPTATTTTIATNVTLNVC